MVALYSHAVPLPPTVTSAARDWSHTWDGCQPPLKGEACYCTMLIGVRKKSRWLPRESYVLPPLAYQLGGGLFSWTRSFEAALRDAREFNARQLERVHRNPKRERITLWAACGWGVCGFESTVRILSVEDAT